MAKPAAEYEESLLKGERKESGLMKRNCRIPNFTTYHLNSLFISTEDTKIWKTLLTLLDRLFQNCLSNEGNGRVKEDRITFQNISFGLNWHGAQDDTASTPDDGAGGTGVR
ncbi:hypothetical protein NDU88_003872 [Pleurodeles waltl]|uniref:Uncharacterized protein n=1 Tax=Pleurodeles waltl TaxID=8319 RepID=A0AAV7QAY7_PLEWA|nr:hypothetical protein NDU88_003872 [Pleurodeles waltl]